MVFWCSILNMTANWAAAKADGVDGAARGGVGKLFQAQANASSAKRCDRQSPPSTLNCRPSATPRTASAEFLPQKRLLRFQLSFLFPK